MEPKPRKPRHDTVTEDGVSPTGARPASKPGNRKDAALESYEQPVTRGGIDDTRSELSRRPESVERPGAGRTAREEP